jgi:hypothetical protein
MNGTTSRSRVRTLGLAELYWVLNTIPRWSPGEDGAYDVLTQDEIDRLFADDVTANR